MNDGSEGDHWSSLSGYAIRAWEIPFAPGDRHRAIGSVDLGTGTHLDRFSAPRLDDFSNAGDWEALSRPVLPGAASDEFFPSRYAITSLEYRHELIFFLFLQARGTLAWLDRPRLAASGAAVNRVDERSGRLVYLRLERAFDPLRSDVRFSNLVDRLHFPS